METWGVRGSSGCKMLSEGPEVKIIIVIMLRYRLVSFFTVLTFAPVVQKHWWVKARVPVILYSLPRPNYRGKKLPVSHKNVLEETKIINYIKYWPLSPHLFNILYDEMGNMLKALLLCVDSQWLSRGKVFVQLNYELNCHIFHGTAFLSERITHEQTIVIQIWIFGEHFLKNELNLSLQGKQLTRFVAIDKLGAFQ